MDMRHAELEESSYQLMMDIQTGRALEPPQPRRRRKLVVAALVVIGGATGLLLAGAHLTGEPTSSGKAIVSPARPPGSSPQSGVFPDQIGLPPMADTPLLKPPTANVQPPPPESPSPAKNPTATSPVPQKSNTVRKQPQRPNRTKQVVKRSGAEPSQTMVRHRSPQLWSRSPAQEFDPNADLVRSSD